MKRPRRAGAVAPTRALRAPAPRATLDLRVLWIVGSLTIFMAICYGHALQVPFIGDDYVYLDKTRQASFFDLWSRANTDFGWYRPWSRELHFWALEHAFGPHEPGFRSVSLLLWLAMLVLYLLLLHRVAGLRMATIAALGVASLSLWGAPLTWISGAQDLWMLVFVLATLVLVDRGRPRWALVPFGLALLSKETAAIVPLVVFAHASLVQRRSWGDSLRATLPFVLVAFAWLALHPVLLHRLTHPALPATGDRPLRPWEIALRSGLSLINLDRLPIRPDPHAWRPVAMALGALVLAVAAGLTLRGERPARDIQDSRMLRARLVGFGLAWCGAGWLPLFSPSVGWHAYYGGLGVLGGWLALAVFLERRTIVVVTLLISLVLLRGGAAATPSWDWGSEWYQTRAGNMLSVIRGQMAELHPMLPPHTRLYFGNIPNNIGLIAGRSPAVRVWYRDPTIQGGFYSYYRPRSANQPDGPDLFFHFDSTSGIREVIPERPPPAGVGRGTEWEMEHESLAITLLRGGDLTRAAAAFESIARLPHRPDALMFAGTCWRSAGNPARAGRLFELARVRTQLSSSEIEAWAERLHKTMPGAAAGSP